MSYDNKDDEVGIKFSRYVQSLSKQWVSSGIVDIDTSQKLIMSALEHLQNNLCCERCSLILPDEEFYRQKAQYANRQRSQICKSCWKETYNMRIPKK